MSDTLRDVPSNVDTFVISSHYKIIYGSEETINAFYPCHTTLTHFSFSDSNPNLETIQPFAFYNCTKLLSIDLSSCSKLTIIGNKAFSYCKAVTTLLLPNGITNIGDEVFGYDSSISSIVIPSSVQRIGAFIFRDCKSLSQLTVETPSNLANLPRWFSYYTRITTFTIPKSVTYVDSAAFEGANQLQSIYVDENSQNFDVHEDVLYSKGYKTLIHFPALHNPIYSIHENCQTIGYASFAASQLSSIKLNNVVTSIKAYGFQGTKLTTISIPSSVTSIDDYAFNHCYFLSSIELPNSLKILTYRLFGSCAFTNFTVPSNITTIKSFCFIGNTKLKLVILPVSLISLGGGAFNDCHEQIEIIFPKDSIFDLLNRTFIVDKQMHSIFQYLGTEENAEIIIPSSIVTIKSGAFSQSLNIISVVFDIDSKISIIEEKAFSNCKYLSSISLNRITKIGNEAFLDCSSLTTLSFGSSLESIGSNCFEGCSKLETVTFEKTSKSLILNNESFLGCTNLQSIDLKEGLTMIFSESFKQCTSLEKIEIPSSVTLLGASCFEGSGIHSISFPPYSKVTVLDSSLFKGCSNLKDIQLHDTIKEIGTLCFAGTSIAKFVVPIKTTVIKDQAFNSCSALENFTIPENCKIETFGHRLFAGCSSLAVITSKVERFVVDNSGLYNKERDNLIVFPPASQTKVFSFSQNVTTVSPGAFEGCTHLKIITIPDESIKFIGFSAFENCQNLELINIPQSVETIEPNAFSGCKKLRCGLFIEERSFDVLKKWISEAGLPEICIHPCVIPTCKKSLFSFSRALISLVFMTIA